MWRCTVVGASRMLAILSGRLAMNSLLLLSKLAYSKGLGMNMVFAGSDMYVVLTCGG
jgi:type IV secretory pathway TrbD component